jgi:hypothetical protein
LLNWATSETDVVLSSLDTVEQIEKAAGTSSTLFLGNGSLPDFG